MTQSTNPRWLGIPSNKRIRIVEDTADFVVIDKPANLRSVPGHATSSEQDAKEPTNRKTAHEAWLLALQSFARDNGGDIASQVLQRLSRMPNLTNIPRKEPLFRRFLERSRQRFHLPSDPQERDELMTQMYHLLVARQRPLMNLPQPTPLEESAMGQLQLWFQTDNHDDPHNDTSIQIRAVHRLDCQTSGIMVFAKTPEAASFLSHAWRQRDQVMKHYLALVESFLPCNNDDSPCPMEGIMEFPMEQSSERLKWQIATGTAEGGKESITKWKVVQRSSESETILLDLQPVTGRTHQLRVHCAHEGSGIIGDSLYGTTTTTSWDSTLDLSHPDAPILHLHAWKLSFPDPQTKQLREYTSYPTWYPGPQDIGTSLPVEKDVSSNQETSTNNA